MFVLLALVEHFLCLRRHIFGRLLCFTTHVWFCLHYTRYLFILKSFNPENKNYNLLRHVHVSSDMFLHCDVL